MSINSGAELLPYWGIPLISGTICHRSASLMRIRLCVSLASISPAVSEQRRSTVLVPGFAFRKQSAAYWDRSSGVLSCIYPGYLSRFGTSQQATPNLHSPEYSPMQNSLYLVRRSTRIRISSSRPAAWQLWTNIRQPPAENKKGPTVRGVPDSQASYLHFDLHFSF